MQVRVSADPKLSMASNAFLRSSQLLLSICVTLGAARFAQASGLLKVLPLTDQIIMLHFNTKPIHPRMAISLRRMCMNATSLPLRSLANTCCPWKVSGVRFPSPLVLIFTANLSALRPEASITIAAALPWRNPSPSSLGPAPHNPKLTPGFAGKLIYTTVSPTTGLGPRAI